MAEMAYIHRNIHHFPKHRKILFELYEQLNRLFTFLAVSSLLTGASGFFMTYVSYLLLGLPPSISICIAVALVSFSVYSLNKISDAREDTINMPERRSFLQGRYRLVLGSSIGAYLAAAALILFYKYEAFFVLLIPFISNALYSSRLVPGIPRLKDIPLMKNLVVSISWGAVTVLLPACAAAPIASTLSVLCFMTVKDFINTVIYDIRDVKGDRESGIKTLPVILGPGLTLAFLLSVNTCLLIWTATAARSLGILALSLIIYGYAYIIYFRRKRSSAAMDILIDGEWALAVLAFFMIGFYLT